ncbi:phospholipase D-like domain-containing protein [Bdellovibrio bacteriovorus]|nr:phosphatidylserine/phosphatidylglycerophosphate/cardiolipin synthase family protein [Bdellovibrio bacteriovorus]
MKFRQLSTIFSICLLLSCQSIKRTPNGAQSVDDAILKVLDIDSALAELWNRNWLHIQHRDVFSINFKRDAAIEDLNFGEHLLKQRSYYAEKANNLTGSYGTTHLSPIYLHNKEEVLSITEQNSYRIGSAEAGSPFPLEHNLFRSYTLRLENKLPQSKKGFSGEPKVSKPLKARLECDGDISYRSGFLFLTDTTSRSVEFNWSNKNDSGHLYRYSFSPEVTKCKFLFYDPEQTNTWSHEINLISIKLLSPQYYKIATQIETCSLPSNNDLSGPERVFYDADYRYVTCPQPAAQIMPLKETYDSINEKVKALTGSSLSKEDFLKNNPEAHLDFSKAPNLDIIWISSLNFSADFHGLILARALRYHALKGTQIRVIVPDYGFALAQKDRAILESLAVNTHNVKIQYYSYTPSNNDDGDLLDQFHRVNHIKLLIGHSSTTPSANFVFTGGRNIRDSYLFRERPNYARFLRLTNYAGGEAPYVFYEDFEIKITGSEYVESVLSQTLAFWHRSIKGDGYHSTAIPTRSEDATQRTDLAVRHILSVPYFDNFQLEKIYVDLINSSSKEILITTPYFRPTNAISQALSKANTRGVKIKLLTSINLGGDGTPKIAEDVSKDGLNRHLNEMDILLWQIPKSIMHAKILVIDNELSFISSINLNHRSFIHDTEAGTLILSKKTATEIRSLTLDLMKKSKKMTEQQRVSWINSILLGWGESYF